MSKSGRLRPEEYRRIAQVVGECRELGDEPEVWTTHLVMELARMIGEGITSIVVGAKEDDRLAGTMCTWGWENGFDINAGASLVDELRRDPFGYNPMTTPYFAAKAREDGICLTRPALVVDSDWYHSNYFDHYNSVGADSTLFCYRQEADESTVCGIILCRRVGERDFTPRERAVVHEVQALVAPQIGRGLASFEEPSPAGLPPQCRRVLRCLLEGDSDKQIAQQLSLSSYTVNEYTKRIYRHFGVQSRAELLARWIKRGWAGRCEWV